MRILVTGGAGYLGTPLVDRLVQEGHKVTILDRVVPNRRERREGVRRIQADINETDALYDRLWKKQDGPEVVYHLAGASNIDTVKDDPMRTVRDTVLSTVSLLTLCRNAGGVKRFILASSVYIYGEEGHLYTTTKRCAEDLCRDFHTLYGVPYTILRYGTVYGKGSRCVVDVFAQRALKGEVLTIHGNGEQRRDFVYIDDAVEASAVALGVEQGTYDVASHRMDIKTIAHLVRNSLPVGSNVRIEHTEFRHDDSVGLGEGPAVPTWLNRVDIKDGIRRTIEWHRGQEENRSLRG